VTLLEWLPPVTAGGAGIVYDVLRFPSAADLGTPACLVTGTGAGAATDPHVPAAFAFYLVRARNACGSHAGFDSEENLRAVPPCP
jgi:hypothetical protein